MTDITALALPEEGQFKRDIEAINRFQQVVHATLIPNQDYGVIPGTGGKPTLLKPGAEKIVKLLGLADTYEIIDRQEDWTKPFFRYLIRCSLCHVGSGKVISEGLGECNSMESKYRYRWVGEKDLPAGVDKAKLVTQVRQTKAGGKWTVYRLENEDIFSQVNTILKMSKKRSLVDAALSAGRLSNVFTQDIEDMEAGDIIEGEKVEEEKPELCPIHKVPFKKFEKDGQIWYSHKTADGWCNKIKLPKTPTEPPSASPPGATPPVQTQEDSKVPPQATPPEKTTTKEVLFAMKFKSPTEFYKACHEKFNLQPIEVDKETPEYDKTNPAQRDKAWQQIVGARS